MEKFQPNGALRAPYETYRESEVLITPANLSLEEMLRIHRALNHSDIVMMEWIVAIDDAELWDLEELAQNPENLFEKIMTLEFMYQKYGQGGHNGLRDRDDFAYAVSECILSSDCLLQDLIENPQPVYDTLEQMGC